MLITELKDKLPKTPLWSTIADRRSALRDARTVLDFATQAGYEQVEDLANHEETVYNLMVSQRDYALATVDRMVGRVNQAIRYANRQGWSDAVPLLRPKNPLVHLTEVPKKPMDANVYRRGDVEKLVFDPKSRLKEVTWFLWLSGCRVSELWSLRTEDIEVGPEVAQVTFRGTKNGSDRTLPTNTGSELGRLMVTLKGWGEGKDTVDLGCSISTYRRAFKEAHRYGLETTRIRPPYRIHHLRHSCATRLIAQGVPLSKVQKWLGHKDIGSTMVYQHLTSDDLVGVV